ncbi:hypothetical protein DFAR_3550006 [Desulfarculales bacterium]
MVLPHPRFSSGTVVTVSIGGAATVPHESLPELELLAQADGALFQAKDQSRTLVSWGQNDFSPV